MTDFRIRIVADSAPAERNIKRTERALGRTTQAASGLERQLKRAFTVGAIIATTKNVIALADAYTNLQNRLRVVTDGQDQLVRSTEQLFSIADDTRTSFEGTAELYTRLSLAARELGVDQKDLLGVTKSVNQAIILSGASAKEANNGLIQLSQGIASNRLSGDELRSVLEQLPVVADVIAKELGVTRGELRKLGEQGKITGDVVINAFKNAREELEEGFGQTVPTIGQSFTRLRNSVIKLVGSFNDATGAAEALATVIGFLAENLEILLPILTAVAGRFAVAFGGRAITKIISLLGFGGGGLGGILTGIRGILTAIASLRTFVGLGIAGAAASVVIKEIKEQAEGVLETLTQIADRGLNAATTEAGRLGNNILRIQANLERAQKTANALNREGLGNEGARRQVIRYRIELQKAEAELQALKDAAADAKKTAEELFTTGQLDLLKNQLELLGLTNQERETAIKLAKIQAEAEKQGLSLLPEQIEEIRQALNNLSATEEAGKVREKVFGDIRGGVIELGNELRALIELQSSGAISADEFNQAYFRINEQIKEARANLDGLSTGDLIKNLQEENTLLAAGNREREVQERLKESINELDSFQRANLTDDQRGEIENLIRLNQRLQENAQIKSELQSVDSRIAEQTRLVNQAFADGAITLDEYRRALRELELQAAQAGTSIADGLKAGVMEALDEIRDLQSTTADLVKFSFQGTQAAVSDSIGEIAVSIKELVKDGQTDIGALGQSIRAIFSNLVDDILAKLQELLAQQVLLALVGGSAGGGLAGLLGGARQEGGPVSANKAFLVGEQGPELFVPNSSGQVFSNSDTSNILAQNAARQQATVVNVQAPEMPPPTVVVVDSKEAAFEAMASERGQRIQTQNVSKNRQAFKRSLG